MAKIIVYPNGSGGVCVVHPTGELPLDQVALKDVPNGVPYLILNDTDMPADRAYRDAWVADFSTPDGIGGVAP